MANYQWRTSNDFNGSPELPHGVTPNDFDSWQTDAIGSTRTDTWDYWFTDTNSYDWSTGTYGASSRVHVNITDAWTTSVDSNNNLTVSVTTTVNSITRGDIVGTDYATPGRTITIHRESGGAVAATYTDTSLNTAHSILSTPLSLGTRTFVIEPGDTGNVVSSVYLRNQVIGGTSYDSFSIGVQFRNPLPADYRPGETYNGGTWYSHNRSAGAAGVYDGSSFREMRTINGDGSTSGDPPYIYNGSAWANQRKIGAGA